VYELINVCMKLYECFNIHFRKHAPKHFRKDTRSLVAVRFPTSLLP